MGQNSILDTNKVGEIRGTCPFTERRRGGYGVCFHISLTCIDLKTAA